MRYNLIIKIEKKLKNVFIAKYFAPKTSCFGMFRECIIIKNIFRDKKRTTHYIQRFRFEIKFIAYEFHFDKSMLERIVDISRSFPDILA